MATYKEIQGWVKEKYGFDPKTYWIAHMKEICGIPTRKAPNRILGIRTNPCPEEKQKAIKSAFVFFKMI
jgi:hypothetical protein